MRRPRTLGSAAAMISRPLSLQGCFVENDAPPLVHREDLLLAGHLAEAVLLDHPQADRHTMNLGEAQANHQIVLLYDVGHEPGLQRATGVGIEAEHLPGA